MNENQLYAYEEWLLFSSGLFYLLIHRKHLSAQKSTVDILKGPLLQYL